MYSRLRIDYLGTIMDLPAKAFAVEHQSRGHEVSYRRAVADVPTAPAPDVVVHSPLDKTDYGLVSTCSLAIHVPPQVLLVPMLGDVGNSHAMFALHARRGNCHPKILLHCLVGGQQPPSDVLDHVEGAVGRQETLSATSDLPPGLTIDADQDLGEIMASKERFALLLYTAAANRSWGSWGDLTRLMNVGDGVVKNVNGELGHVLKEARLVPRDERWTSQRFARFVTEHRSFIVAFGQGHLRFEPPSTPFWWSHTAS